MKRSQQTERHSFFADENFSPRIVDILTIFDQRCDFTHVSRELGQGATDEAWLNHVAKLNPKPHILCGDGNILKNSNQLEALQGTACHFIILAGGYVNLPFEQQVIKILQSWKGILKAVAKKRDARVFRVTMNSLIEEDRRLSDIACRQTA